MEIIKNLDTIIVELINDLGILGPILSCFLILIESIFPVLPLGVFITLNFITFGNLLGFIISWIFTIIGCLISFYIFRKGLNSWFDKKIKDKDKVQNFMSLLTHISLGKLVVIIAIPFTPAFAVNIAAGLSKISEKKFIVALLIGKLGLVYFWGYIGTSLLQSFKDPGVLIRIIFLVLGAYFISLLVNKKFNLE